MAQYSWYTWVALPDVIYILAENKFRKSYFFLLKLKTDTSSKLHPHKMAKYPQTSKIGPHEFNNICCHLCKYMVSLSIYEVHMFSNSKY